MSPGLVAGTVSAAPRVPMRALGKTNLVVSAIGLGLAAVGRPAYMALGRDHDIGADRSVTAMSARCNALLDAAYDAGIRYIDVARSYGFAEQFLNAWWKQRFLRDGDLTVGSKWGYAYTGGWQLDAPIHEVKRLTIDMLKHQFSESRAILGTRLSLFQIHSATLESRVLEDRRILEELGRLRERGVCIGLTVTGPRQDAVIRRALDVRVDGRNPFQTVQATWNLLEPSAGPALAEAKAEGWGVIVKEVLANGRLTNRHAGVDLGHLQAHASANGTTLECLAVAAALAHPWADVVLSGAATPGQLAGHLSALTLKADARRLGSFAESPEAYWRRRSALRWS